MLRLVQTRHSTYFAASTPARTILTGTGTARRICNNVLSTRQNRTIHKSLIPETTLFLIFATLLPSLPPAVRRTAKRNLQKQVPSDCRQNAFGQHSRSVFLVFGSKSVYLINNKHFWVPLFPFLAIIFASFFRFMQANVSPTFISIRAFPIICV